MSKVVANTDTIPNFIVIGAPKAGSTTLHLVLGRHPDIFVPRLKEPNYFCDDSTHYGDWAWYQSLFADRRSESAVGEASVAYSLIERNPSAPPRIATALPQARLIYVVRDPLTRMESAWRHHRFRGNPVPDSFPEAVRNFRPLLEGSLYWRNLSAFRSHFPDRNIHVIIFDELRDCPSVVIERCDRFLGVDPARRPQGAGIPASNRSDNFREPRRGVPKDLMAQVKRLPGGPMRSIARRVMTRPVPRPEWDDASRRWAIEQLRADTSALLEYLEQCSSLTTATLAKAREWMLGNTS